MKNDPRNPVPRIAIYFASLMALGIVSYLALQRDLGTSRSRGSMVCATDDTSRWSPMFRDRMPDVALVSLDRTPVSLHGLAGGRLTAILFCSSKCPCSDGYVDRLKILLERYGSRGVAFIAVNSNSDETFDDLKSYIARRGYPLPVYRDGDCAAADAMRARVTPEAFVFTPDWRLQYHGRIDDDKSGILVSDKSLQFAIDTLLSGKPLLMREKTSLGCAIQRPRG